METKIKTIFFLTLLIFCYKMQAQEDSRIRAGLLKTYGTLTPAYMFSGKHSNFYFHGGLEGYTSSKLSISGEFYYYLGELGANPKRFAQYANVFYGVSRHFAAGNSDFYVGFQPGFALTKLNAETTPLADTRFAVNPVFSPLLGFNFYASSFFHFFAQGRLVVGEHITDQRQNLAELRLSAGLGFNLNAMK